MITLPDISPSTYGMLFKQLFQANDFSHDKANAAQTEGINLTLRSLPTTTKRNKAIIVVT